MKLHRTTALLSLGTIASAILIGAATAISFNAGELLATPSFYVVEADTLDRATGICTHQGGVLSYTMSKAAVLMVTCSDNIESGENSHFVH